MQTIIEYIFRGLPDDLRRLIEELIDDRKHLVFGLGMIGADTPIEVIKCDSDYIEIDLLRFQSSARGKLTGWREGGETRVKVFISDLDWQNSKTDGWNILYNHLIERNKIQQLSQANQEQINEHPIPVELPFGNPVVLGKWHFPFENVKAELIRVLILPEFLAKDIKYALEYNPTSQQADIFNLEKRSITFAKINLASSETGFTKAEGYCWKEQELFDSIIDMWKGYMQGAEKPKQERGAHIATEYKIKDLQKIRSDAIKNNQQIPKRKAAAGMVSIDYKTWKKHAPDLFNKWDNES